jgi:hypothetical protein
MTRWLDGRREWETHVGLYQMESDIGKIVVEEVHWNWYRGNAMSVSAFMGFLITT